MNLPALYVVGSTADPLTATLLGGAVLGSDEALTVLTVDPRPALSPGADHAIGHLLSGTDADPADTPEDVARTLWADCVHEWEQGNPIAVWDAPTQMTMLQRYAGGGPVGDILDLKLLDRLTSRRPGRRNPTTAAAYVGITEPATTIDDMAALIADTTTAILDDHPYLPALEPGWQAKQFEQQTIKLAAYLLDRRKPIGHLDKSWPVRDPDNPNPIV